MPPRATVEKGEFGALLIARALAPVCRPGTRGRITVLQASATRVLWWVDGHIRAVTSKNDNEWLGSWLLTKGLVSGPLLARALKSRGEGEPLGAALVRLGDLNPLRLQLELEELSYALAARIVVNPGAFEAEAGLALPAGTETVNRSPRALFAAGVRRVVDLDALERVLGGGRPWQATAVTAATEKGCELTSGEHAVRGQLEMPKSLEKLRAAAPDQYQDTVRALAVLVVTGLATSQCTSSAAARAADSDEHASPPPAGGREQRNFPPASPRVRELLTRLEQVDKEAMTTSSWEAPQRAVSDARRKGEAFRRTALRMLAEGGDDKAAYRLLVRAASLSPSAGVFVELARYEIQHEAWHSQVVEHLKRALQLDATCEEAWSLLAEFWALRHQEDKHRRTLERWLAAVPTSTAARDRLARLTPTNRRPN